MPHAKQAEGPFTIGALSRRSGCTVDTIRYYERFGLLPEPPRTAGGHRLYNRRHVERLNFIRRSRQLALPLERIRQMLGRLERTGYQCAEAKVLLQGQLTETRGRIKELRALESSLKTMLAACGEADAASCAVIESLFADESAAPRPRCCD